MKLRLSVLFIFLLQFAFAQFTDDFSDNDFTANPVWTPSAPTDFVVSGGQLQSNNTTASSTFYITTPSTLAANCQWEFFVNLKFATSGSNYVDIYLTADNSNLSSATLNGYFVRVGNTLDEICLYKNTAGTSAKIIDGTDGIVASSSNNLIKIKVKRDASNLFTLERDMSGTGSTYVSEGSITDASFTTSAFFGILIKQSTASFFQKHFFDDFYAGPIITDITPPTIVSATATSSNQLDVLFSENLDAVTAQTISNYTVNNSIGTPSSATLDGSNFKLVHLTFASSFVNAIQHTITVSGVQDLAGNAITGGTANFSYISFSTPGFKDVLINEIMVDVNPVPAGVPAKQYLELYNRSSSYFNLNGWQFSDAVSTSTITVNYTFAPNSYVLIAKTSDTVLFTAIQNKIGTATFPTYNTGGDPVFLRDNTLTVIDSIRYTPAWYNDAVKDDGGWSLELINPGLNSSCISQSNWTASNNTNGGTPGAQNSVFSNIPDNIAPQPFSITALDATTLQVCFNEAISYSLLSNATNYTVSGSIGSPSTVVASSDLKCVTLTFGTTFTSQTTYTLTFSSLADCSGNVVNPGSGTFVYTQIDNPVFNDVIITEIMVDVNPVPAGLPAKQYLEIYNKSSKYFNINNWQFADAASTSTIQSNRTLNPGSYLLIVKASDTALFAGINNKTGTATFPSYNVTGDPVFLYDNAGNILDSIRYTTAWYNDAVKDDGGWSLELINPALNSTCLAQSNWTASNNTNGGTPGTQNSVYNTTPDLSSPAFTSVTVIDSVSIQLCFNEAINSSLLSNASLFTVNNGIGTASAAQASTDYKCVTLQFSVPFTSQGTYTASFSSLADCSGNTVMPGSTVFTYYQISSPSFNEIIITEMMVDVNPAPNGLPAKQYIELYNKSNKYFNLHNMQFSDAVSSATVAANYILNPGSYVMLTKASDTALFSGINNKIGTSSFPSYNTTGDAFYLIDANGNYIDSLHYTDDWYNNSVKKSGGWSLELINPTLNSNCELSSNWTGTNNLNGGTPGTQNSVYNASPDVTGPQPLQVSVSDSLHITICFNEAISSNLINNPLFYSISGGIGTPASAGTSGNNKCIDLTLSVPLQNQTSYTLSLSGLSDCVGNPVSPSAINFSYYIAQPYDVVINELFADPDPQIALPNGEYIELYNRTTFAVSLKDWTLTVGSKTMILPDAVILPDSFVVIIDDAALNSFVNEGYGSRPLVIVADMSSNELNATGELVMLRDRNNTVISLVEYSDSWYGDISKQSGGWSLELIDPNNPCAGSNNWRASVNVAGGTPGVTNSIRNANPDNSAPQLLRVTVNNTDTIVAIFNEPMQYSTLINPLSYTISGGIGNPINVLPLPNDYKKCILVLPVSLQASTVYTLTVTQTVKDCAGNLINTENTARFGLPQNPAAGDIVINELLFDPKSGGVDYAELYNNSEKIINLYDVYIGEGVENGTLIDDSVQISPDGYLLFPQEYVLLSESEAIVKSQYLTTNPKAFLDMQDLPSMNTSSDVVVIADKQGNEIDKVVYTDAMHFALLNDKKGVSLERIDFNRKSSDPTNWNSASANVGFGTPGYRNSQYMQVQGSGNFSVSPEIFSPDNDGYNDVVTINYKVEEPGMAGNITIYDSRGVFVKYLVKNENLATEGSYSWNGITEKNEKAPIGIYIIYFETFSMSGKVEKHKLTCVLAGKL